MHQYKTIFLALGMVFCVSAIIVSSSCTDRTEQEKLRRYYSAIDAQVDEMAPQPGAGSGAAALAQANGATTILNGTPRVAKDGTCGDGIINGSAEDCDQNAIQNTSCRDYGGIAGVVRCQPNCLYDISDCMTPRADKDIGGIAETCKCRCNSSECTGGCKSTAVNGQAACEFDCDNECTCSCQGKLNAAIEECKVRCVCTVDVNGNPDCACNLAECDFLTTISHNIGTLVVQPRVLPNGG